MTGQQSWWLCAQTGLLSTLVCTTAFFQTSVKLLRLETPSCTFCALHTVENCAKSADHNVPYCETFNRSVVKLLQFYLQNGGAKNTAALKKLFEENGISFVKLGNWDAETANPIPPTP
ncbi:hypothetical protein ILYODFUR_037359, partial [Ilyodon furcidens]